MRVNVIRAFIDKKTGQGYNAGSVYETDDAARAQGLYKSGFVTAPSVEKKAKAPAKRTTAKKAVAK